jgi:hypothetical protein
MIVRCSMASSGFYAQEPNGVTFQSAMGLGKRCINALDNGVIPAPSTALYGIYIYAYAKMA